MEGNPESNFPPESYLSPEEAQVMARELQRKLKEDRDKREKELELQRERDRLKSSKELSEARRLFDDQERKRAIDEQVRERKKVQDELKEAQDALRREKEEKIQKEPLSNFPIQLVFIK